MWFSRQDIVLATLFANLLPRRSTEILSLYAKADPMIACNVAQRMPPREAIQMLLPHAANPTAAAKLHELIASHKHEGVLACVSQAAVTAIIDSAGWTREQTVATLSFFACYDSPAAISLARRLPKEQAIKALEPHATTNSYVAEKVSELLSLP